MTPPRKSSRRPSAANSAGANRLSETRFYLDESIYSRHLRERMCEAGAKVEHAGGAFPFGTLDEVWLTACGERHWIVLTRDQRIRGRVLEREAIRQSGAAVFALTAGKAIDVLIKAGILAEVGARKRDLLYRYDNYLQLLDQTPWPRSISREMSRRSICSRRTTLSR